MLIDPSQLEVKNNAEKHRFEVTVDDKTAMVEYRIAGKTIVFTHTEVPAEFQGMGVGNRMAQVALEYAKAEGYKVRAICPFITAYLRRHPEYQSIPLE